MVYLVFMLARIIIYLSSSASFKKLDKAFVVSVSLLFINTVVILPLSSESGIIFKFLSPFSLTTDRGSMVTPIPAETQASMASIKMVSDLFIYSFILTEF